jgi:hypothetical protein
MRLLSLATRSRGPGTSGRGRRLVGAALAAAERDRRVFDDLTDLGLAEGPLTPRIALGLVSELARARTAASPTG